eukprot:TRINITY_DN7494_c0_g1_i1.p1 TRINITY_DN7494_c0_g1~~TRINITY_DN7494_c0_g1_i1.p1  ORF type:complete len:999 (-),score=215.81 TRINITY_DN7494_c0_g1_i1:38-3034(-)
MEPVPSLSCFSELEEEVLKYWKAIDAFRTSFKQSEGRPEYSFYDGPPFATGPPHYGHILTSTIKDTVTRYAHQTGHHVRRRFGWDAHGLPIEFEVDRRGSGISSSSREDVSQSGIHAYNERCRSLFEKNTSNWESVITRTGCWVEFGSNGYNTSDVSYMESVWWVFKTLFEKGLVYQAVKVVPYSTGCKTPLSDFEAGLNYKEACGSFVVVGFPIESDPEVLLLAWTSSPWTLPSNLALCVNPNVDYVKLKDKATNKTFVLSESGLEIIYKKAKPQKDSTVKSEEERYEILETFKGSALKGIRYVPLFDYFIERKQKGAFQVLVDEYMYVSNENGTGIVPLAPGFDEKELRVCLINNIVTSDDMFTICPLDANGCFLANITEFAGKYIKDAERDIIDAIKVAGRLVSSGRTVQTLPFCWSSETQLIHRPVACWFVAVENIKDRLLDNIQQARWIPDSVREKRFDDWLSRDARDWAVSRTRYWGTPIPIWKNDSGELVCIGSIEELERMSGRKIVDIHRENVDDITVPSRLKGGAPLKRVEEVFDCWFESGCMPYAHLHYPFENQELFAKSFPADFIAEGLDQTRGWFYTLMVLSTALFDQPAFKNVIVNGLVLSKDYKLGNRLRNAPDPMKLINDTGTDALRLYLLNSPAVRGEILKFNNRGAEDMVKDVLVPLYSAYSFLVQSTLRFESLRESEHGVEFKFIAEDLKAIVHKASNNIMNKWILSYCQSLIKFVRSEMECYRLFAVIPKLSDFIDQLYNCYIYFNRKILKGSDSHAWVAINVLFHVIYALVRLMAPFAPFITETIYQNLKKALPANEEKQDSVHYLMIPEPFEQAIDLELENDISRLRAVIRLGRLARDKRKLPFKMQLKELLVVSANEKLLEALRPLKHYLAQGLNVLEVVFSSDVASFISLNANPNAKALGPRLKADCKNVFPIIQSLTNDQLRSFIADPNFSIQVEGHAITRSDLIITPSFAGDQTCFEAGCDDDVLVALRVKQD